MLWATTLAGCLLLGGQDLALRLDGDGDGVPRPEDCDDADARNTTTVADSPLWYADADGDGWGDPTSTVQACGRPSSFVDVAGDCDDGNFGANPGVAEICYDGLDADCLGDDDFDCDGDGERAAPSGADCDDANAAVYPGATEVCGDGVDADCDPLTGACILETALVTAGWGMAIGAPGDQAGVEVRKPGVIPADSDVTGDGVVDYLVGAPYAADQSGVAWLLPGPVEGVVELPLAARSWTHGTAPGDLAGWVLSGSADLDGDGLNELMVGSPGADGGAGLVQVFSSGSAGILDPADALLTLLGQPGFGLGTSAVGLVNITTADDALNGPRSDCLVSAPGHEGGHVYVVKGPLTGTFDVTDAQGMVLRYGAEPPSGEDGPRAGFTVAGAADMDADGFADVIIAAPGDESGGEGAGAVYVVQKPQSTGVLRIDDMAEAFYGEPGSGFGQALVPLADITGDGYKDLLVGAPEGKGQLLIFSSAEKGEFSGKTWEEADLRLRGIESGDALGASVTGVVDVTGDGDDDVVVGAPGAADGAGVVHILAGGSIVALGESGFITEYRYGAATGPAGSAFGASVVSGGDSTGDGASDPLIGAPLFSPDGGEPTGAVFVMPAALGE